MRRGVALFAGTPAGVVAEAAAASERLGYFSFWLNHPGLSDGVAGLASAARATVAIALGVGVVPLHQRSAVSVANGVRAAGLPQERLLLGIGSAGPGAFRLAREGAGLLRRELGCTIVMGALGEPACRLAGEIADGVLLNWLTPAHALRSRSWIAEGAEGAGVPMPQVYAYVRLALGAGARARVEEEGARYARGSYGGHFARMNAAPLETAIAAEHAAPVRAALAQWEGVVDEVVLRLLPGAPDLLEEQLAMIAAGAP